jgi:ribonuclease HII
MTEVSAYSLAVLRARIRATEADAELRRLAELLAADARTGARLLAEVAVKRREALRAERRRIARLFALRARLSRGGVARIAGVDEVGVGPLAGPVVACAVVLPGQMDLPGLDDSKRLTPRVRERLAAAIREQALEVSIGVVSPADVDRLNVYRAALEAMRRAVEGLSAAPDHVLVDARTIPSIGVAQTAIVAGDRTDGSIAAASIVAKVHRDAIMVRLARRYPGYGFEQHKGYPTPDHLAALEQLGASPEHRRSFAPVAQLGLL